MIYTGQKISLRRITHDDCTLTYVSWLNDPEVSRYLETRHTPQNLFSVVEFVSQQMGSKNSHLLAIIENFTSQHIGNIKIGPIDKHHMTADISYFLGKAHWGNGFATEAITGATRYAFDTLGLRLLKAGCYGRNVGSLKALQRCGFQEYGRIHNALLCEDGTADDHVYLSLHAPVTVTPETRCIAAKVLT